MDLRPLSQTVAVAPQITPEDVAQLAALGYRTLIDNRPDEEVGPELRSEVMARAAAEAGMAFYYLPYYPGEMTFELVEAFEAALAEAPQPVFGYCRSGTRSSHLWAMARAGEEPLDQIVAAAAAAGYDHSALIPVLSAQAARRKNA